MRLVRNHWPLVAVAAFLAALAFLFFVPRWEVNHTLGDTVTEVQKLAAENQTRATWAQILGGVFVLAGLFFAWLRLEASQRNQITDRYIRAIDQLGSEKTEVRLGAIYGLERIANESPQEHWAIIEVLTAFIRNHRPWNSNLGLENREAAHEVAAILAVLARRNRVIETRDQVILLGAADLRKARLFQAHFERANLAGIHLEGAVAAAARDATQSTLLRSLQVKGGKIDVDLKRYDHELSKIAAHFEFSHMVNARLDGFIAIGSRFEHASLIDACADGAMLSNSHFEHANLGRASFQHALLQGAYFANAFMHEVNLKGARLDRADFSHATLGGTDHRGVIFKDCKMDGANLTNADLRGADLSTARGLSQEQIRSARIDATTKLPTYLGGVVEPAAVKAEALTVDELLSRVAEPTGDGAAAPTVRDLGCRVDSILDALANGLSRETIKDIFQGVDDADIRACLLYAAKLVQKGAKAAEKGP
jgi:uncharacterized protein YjbI with pentapeptide repeats